MAEHWLDITDIPAEGRDFSFSDQEFWERSWREFHMDIRPRDPLTAEFRVVPDSKGAFVRGRIGGSVVTACDRCAGDATVRLDQPFELFEELLPDGESLEPALLRRRGSRLELNVGAMLWEEFVLAMPVKPLCAENCRGLCPVCGADLNVKPCSCGGDGSDPRLAAFRSLKIVKKS